MVLIPGKIYYSTYGRWKHDSRPLIFVLHSDYNKTHAINLHYFTQLMLVQFLYFVKTFSQKFPLNRYDAKGIYYNILKPYYPLWVKKAYRTYFTAHLNGYPINEGITAKMPTKQVVGSMHKSDAVAVQINKNLPNTAMDIKQVQQITPQKPVNMYAGQNAQTQQNQRHGQPNTTDQNKK